MRAGKCMAALFGRSEAEIFMAGAWAQKKEKAGFGYTDHPINTHIQGFRIKGHWALLGVNFPSPKMVSLVSILPPLDTSTLLVRNSYEDMSAGRSAGSVALFAVPLNGRNNKENAWVHLIMPELGFT
eukprot:1156129-Pelagomonas_calceolata.AAC.9